MGDSVPEHAWPNSLTDTRPRIERPQNRPIITPEPAGETAVAHSTLMCTHVRRRTADINDRQFRQKSLNHVGDNSV